MNLKAFKVSRRRCITSGSLGSGRTRSDDGVALILVLSVLMALMVLAVPMLTVARQESAASVAPFARAKARAVADGMVRYAEHRLQSGHRDEEALRAGAPVTSSEGSFVHATPDYDTAAEAEVPPDLLNERGQPLVDGEGTPFLHRTSGRDVTTDLKVRDEQAWPNLISAPPFLIAASLARTTLGADITDKDTEIQVEDTSAFPAKGAIYLNGEIITYSSKEPGRFVGCQRGAEGGLKARAHRSDAYVLDDRSREITTLLYASPKAKGGWREPVQPTFVKEIALLGRSALSPLEVDRLVLDFATLGRRSVAGAFGEKVTVRAPIDPAADDGNGFPIQVTTAEGFNPGTIVRLSDGIQEEFGIVMQARSQGGFFGGGFGTLRLAKAPRGSYEIGRTTVQPMLRHPVNINSAPSSVLYRLIEGVEFVPGGRPQQGSPGRVSGESATIVVEGILANRPFRDFQHFRKVLQELVEANKIIFTSMHAEAVFRNAVDANDVALLTSTVPFSFQSYDYYTIEGSAVVNDQSGRELARESIRQRVHVSPSGWLQSNFDTQWDFEDSLVRSRSGRYVTTFPFPVERWVSATQIPASRIPRMLQGFGGNPFGGAAQEEQKGEEKKQDARFEDGVFPSRDEGHVQLIPARMESRGYNKHFDGPAQLLFPIEDPGVTLDRINPEGWLLSGGPFKIDPRDASGGFGGGGQTMQVGGRTRRTQGGAGGPSTVEVRIESGQGGGGGLGGGGNRGGGNRGGGSLMGRTTPNPVRVDMWYRFGGGAGGRHVLYDFVGENADEDRITLSRENDGALVARVADRTLDDPSDSVEEVAVTRWEPEVGGFWQPNTWYHLGVGYRGSHPNDVALFADGMKRGRARFHGTLSGNFDANDTNFSIEDAEGWPDFGVAMVGSEVVAFERNGNSFDVLQFQGQTWGRGQRGTRRLSHTAGEPVTLFGYSGLPRTANGNSGTCIPPGGATLKDSLSHWCVASFDSNTTISINVPGPGGIPLVIQLEVHDPSKPNGSILTLNNNSLGVPDFDAFPASGGYIVIVSADVPVPGAPQGGIEFAKYQSRAGNQLIGLQSVPNPPNPDLAAAGGNAVAPISVQRLVHPVRLAGQGSVPSLSTLAVVFPVSIALTSIEGYLEPEAPQGNSAAAGPLAAWNTDPEFVQLGLPNTRNLEQNDIEWVRYHHIDESGSHLLCDEVRFIQAAAFVLEATTLGGGALLGAHDRVGMFFPFRRQCGTALLSNGRISSGTEVVPCIRTEAMGARTAINNPNYSPTVQDAPVNGQRWSFAGFGDSVTIEGQNSRDRKRATVAWAGVDEWTVRTLNLNGQQIQLEVVRDYPGQGWIAFSESLGVEYRQRSLPRDGLTQSRTNYVRLLKFPSGELPDMGRAARAYAGGDAEGQIGSQDAILDEVRVTPFEPERYVLWNHTAADFPQNGTGTVVPSTGINETVDEIPIANVQWVVSAPTVFGSEPVFYILPDGRKIHYDEELRGLPTQDAGLVQIGEEVIAFRGVGRGQSGGPALLDCQRGFLGTIPTKHGMGENVVFLDYVNVSRLQSAMDGTSATIPVASLQAFFQNGGTVLIENEMMHYTELQTGSLSMPLALNDQGEATGGLFRGRYGTTSQAHDAGAIVLEMPYRYWDRYAPRQDSGEMSYYGFSLDLPGAFFHKITMEEYRPNPATDIEILCRTDPSIPWTADPKKTPGLYLFEEATAADPALVNRAGRGLDVRVLFRYLPGAFPSDLLSGHDWKTTPELRSISVTYADETRVLGRENRK